MKLGSLGAGVGAGVVVVDDATGDGGVAVEVSNGLLAVVVAGVVSVVEDGRGVEMFAVSFRSIVGPAAAAAAAVGYHNDVKIGVE